MRVEDDGDAQMLRTRRSDVESLTVTTDQRLLLELRRALWKLIAEVP